MSLHFTINGERFWVDPFPDGYAWVSHTDEGQFCYPTQAEAQQEALDYVRIRDENERAAADLALEESVYGSYDDQVRREYNYQIRH